MLIENAEERVVLAFAHALHEARLSHPQIAEALAQRFSSAGRHVSWTGRNVGRLLERAPFPLPQADQQRVDALTREVLAATPARLASGNATTTAGTVVQDECDSAA